MSAITLVDELIVTPYAGVWIEMKSSVLISRTMSVTPYAGVWIEIIICMIKRMVDIVTPYAGVWIEIYRHDAEISGNNRSLPTRECGLKFFLTSLITKTTRHSLRGSVD